MITSKPPLSRATIDESGRFIPNQPLEKQPLRRPDTDPTARTTSLFEMNGVLALGILCGALFAALVGLIR